MPTTSPLIYDRDIEPLPGSTMLLAFTGWMDGGDVSTGTVKRLIRKVGAKRFAHLDPEPFFIYNIPGGMEIASMFRPKVKIVDGVVKACEFPHNRFYIDPEHKLLFFVGREPNINWRLFGQCIFAVAARAQVTRLLFVGSFGGSVPHTREPRLYATVSDSSLQPMLDQYGVRQSNYEGPGSFTTSLMTQARERGLQMISLVAEIPSYVQGTNPISIEAVTRRLTRIIGVPMDMDQLRGVSDEWESRVTAAIEKDPELVKHIRELEKQYDDELLESPLHEDMLGEKSGE